MPAGVDSHDASPTTTSDVARMFTAFAATYPELPLYRVICEGAAADDEVCELLLAARPGQARPVLFLAALQDLLLRSPDLPAARWYPSVTGAAVPDGDPWPDVRATCLDHGAELRSVIGSRTTQTNEVNRVVHLAPLVAQACIDVPSAPVVLVEMGASAGLLLGLDRYRIELDVASEGEVMAPLGDPGSPVVCRGELHHGRLPEDAALPTIVERVGLDLHPVILDDADEIRWLEACLWPEVPGRLDRFRTAVAVLRPDPPRVVEADMVDDLGPVAHAARAVASASQAASSVAAEAVHVVVFSTWALTYVSRERRPEVATALAGLAVDGRPVSWVTAEPPGCVPDIPAPDSDHLAGGPGGDTVLGARRWRQGRELAPACWGTAHPHGTWLRWTPTP